MGVSWQRQPVRFLMHQVKASPAFTPQAKQHFLLWLDDIMPLVPDDPIIQCVALSAAHAYAQSTRLLTDCIHESPLSEGAETRARMLILWQGHTAKMLRTAGLRKATTGKGKRGLPSAPSLTSKRSNSDERDLPPDLAPDDRDDVDQDEANVR